MSKVAADDEHGDGGGDLFEVHFSYNNLFRLVQRQRERKHKVILNKFKSYQTFFVATLGKQTKNHRNCAEFRVISIVQRINNQSYPTGARSLPITAGEK